MCHFRGIQNVQNIDIDGDGFLWILDGGKTSILESRDPPLRCPQKLLIHDLNLNKTLLKYTFPSSVAPKRTFFYHIVVDDEFAYITDNSLVDPGIIVLMYGSAMRADPYIKSFSINGETFAEKVNLAGIALGPNGLVYYSPIFSYYL